MSDHTLTIQSLSTAYGTRSILKEICLTVHPGQILAVIGPNGAGKSTLIRAISGVLPVQNGSVHVGKTDLANLTTAQRARRVAVVPQARELPGAYTVYQVVLLGRTPHLGWLGQTNAEDHRQVHLALEQTQLQELADRYISSLSGGEQQRVLLARALVQQTPVLLMDEPTTHLDLHHQSRLLNLVRRLTTQENLTVMIVLHDLNLASLYADQVALLIDGRLEAIGAPQAVLTEENLSSLYDVPVSIIPHPVYGTPLVLPDGHNPLPLNTKPATKEKASCKSPN